MPTDYGMFRFDLRRGSVGKYVCVSQARAITGRASGDSQRSTTPVGWGSTGGLYRVAVHLETALRRYTLQIAKEWYDVERRLQWLKAHLSTPESYWVCARIACSLRAGHTGLGHPHKAAAHTMALEGEKC